ncbi:MAG: hypothetical protein MUC98_03165 [Desulfobacterota bacterium]|jgi:retron-type reverse transcriptase|nr:hypothetical protein [Thermodesulfobacteriota bacterium]
MVIPDYYRLSFDAIIISGLQGYKKPVEFMSLHNPFGRLIKGLLPNGDKRKDLAFTWKLPFGFSPGWRHKDAEAQRHKVRKGERPKRAKGHRV